VQAISKHQVELHKQTCLVLHTAAARLLPRCEVIYVQLRYILNSTVNMRTV